MAEGAGAWIVLRWFGYLNSPYDPIIFSFDLACAPLVAGVEFLLAAAKDPARGQTNAGRIRRLAARALGGEHLRARHGQVLV